MTDKQAGELAESRSGYPSEVDRRAGAFFGQAHQAYLAAEKVAGGPVDRFYRIAGRLVRLRFANEALIAAVTPALEHLRTARPVGEPSLTICLWDTAGTGVAMPAPPWEWDAMTARGERRGLDDARFHAAYQPDAGILSLMETAARLGVYWIDDAQRVPFYETASPLRSMLGWWARSLGHQVVHGAAAGGPGGGVLIVGKGGSGKSTTSLVCLAAGLLYAGDNNLILAEEPGPMAHSLYNSATLEPHHILRFPHLLPGIRNGKRLETEKAMIFAGELFPGRMAAEMRIRAILLPKVAGRPETRLVPASPAAALTALAPSSIFSLPGAGGESFAFMGRFVRSVPAYVLELGTDLDGISAAVSELLSRSGQ